VAPIFSDAVRAGGILNIGRIEIVVDQGHLPLDRPDAELLFKVTSRRYE
jgi:hypothetical protein